MFDRGMGSMEESLMERDRRQPMSEIKVTEKDIGRRITFRAVCVWDSGKVTRTIRGTDRRGHALVQFGGWKDFAVRPHEILSIQ